MILCCGRFSPLPEILEDYSLNIFPFVCHSLHLCLNLVVQIFFFSTWLEKLICDDFFNSIVFVLKKEGSFTEFSQNLHEFSTLNDTGCVGGDTFCLCNTLNFKSSFYKISVAVEV